MSSSDSGTEEPQSTRPISVAELLARNGSIGAPPAGGHRRRRRGNSNAVSVAELTAEIPIIRDEPPAPAEPEASEPEPVVEPAEETLEEAIEEAAAEAAEETVSSETVVIYATPDGDESESTMVVVAEEPVVEEPVAEEPVAEEEEVAEEEVSDEPDEAAEPAQPVDEAGEAGEEAPAPEPAVTVAPPLASDPLPRRSGGPERSHDPRPLRRSSGAEQMAYDPVDESVNLDDLVNEAAGDTEALRSYLKASGGTLFSGETVADDMARRDAGIEAGEAAPTPTSIGGPPQQGGLAALRTAAVAALQSVLAVAFGAGLFIGFDQLWRWNTIVALVLSVLVILGLVIAVRIVRRTEDIASTLIAVAVGALVTLGPLALLQSYG